MDPFDRMYSAFCQQPARTDGRAHAAHNAPNLVARKKAVYSRPAHAQHQHRHSTPHVTQLPHTPHTSAARKNNALNAKLLEGEIDRPYTQGQLRYVARGVYTSGGRKGQLCAIKWPKMRRSLSKDSFKHDINAANATLAVVNQWNTRGIIDQPIRVNIPVVWRLSANMGHLAGTRVLVEPFIAHFRKWNSNTGWVDTTTHWGRVMQALSHYSYHISNGRTLVCDLQGGFYEDHAVVTNPVVCSTSRSYGTTDMGAKGITNFFARHKCNEYCRKSWKKPKQAIKHLSAVRSTYMLSM